MPRESTTEAAEYERLRNLSVPPQDKVLKSNLFAAFVDVFAARLLPLVKSGLELEASSDIATEWILEATSALKALAPELPDDLESQAEFTFAMESTRRQLTEEISKGVLKPSEAEIRRESIELAQCVLANWLALLEHTKEDVGDAIHVVALTANAIPEARSLDELFEGVEAFAVTREAVVERFDEFLTSRFTVGEVFQLAPRLFLARAEERGFFLADSEEAAFPILPAVMADHGHKLCGHSNLLRQPFEYRRDTSGM